MKRSPPVHSRTDVTMTVSHRHRLLLTVLAAAVLMSLTVPAVDARIPHARAYRVGGPIGLDTTLRSRSGVSAWAIDEYLASTTSLPPLGKAFLAAERKYKVNARFLLAAAMHESAWGTSAIARVKHNLFGYNAYDRDPFRYASAYATYAANINATAKFIRDFYLKPGGRWWGGAPTLRSMQQYWSSSHTWGVNVSRIATSIRLRRFSGRALTFAAPVVRDGIHGGDRIRVRLTWSGGRIPAGVKFVAQWVPVQLDTDAVAAVLSGPAPTKTTARSSTAGPATRPAITVAAARSRARARSVTLTIKAPKQPGRYQLQVGMRDTDRHLLPTTERVSIPTVGVRIWGERAISVNLAPAPDGLGSVVRITNTGRKVIPATPKPAKASAPGLDLATSRTFVTVTSSGDAPDPSLVTLSSAPLARDLAPGASATFTLPGSTAALRRSASWLSVVLTVPGQATSLVASASTGTWSAGAVPGLTTSAGAVAPLVATPSRAMRAAPLAPEPSATPAPTPTATPAPTTTPEAQQLEPKPLATPAPKVSATPAPKHVTRAYSERSSAVSYRGAWASASGAYGGGRVEWSKTAGSTATLRFTGTSVSWTGPVGPTRGLALVLIDGRAVARISLWRSTYQPRVVLFKRSFRTSGKHTLTIKVLSMPGHPYVAIDGFVVRS